MNIKNTIAAILFSAILTASIVFPLTTLPGAAGAVSAKETYAFIGANPNPVGVGQSTWLHVGIPDALRVAADGFEGLKVIVTKPDNSTETIGPIRTDSTGGTGVIFTPTTVGKYYLQTHFPGQWYNYSGYDWFGNPVSDQTYYKESYSSKLELIVQEEPIPYYPGAPLPSEYWSRPINAQLREWYTISGNWLVPTPILPVDNIIAEYNDDAPESAHVLWVRPIGDTMGGLAGGIDETGYGTGDAYEGKMNGGIVIGGIYYYNKYDSGQPQQQVVAVDLHTGKELWTKSLANNGVFYGNGRIAFGQVLRWSSMNYQGDFSYLWVTSGNNWYAFEPLNGDWKYNMTNVPSGSNYYGPKGEILRYSMNTAKGWLAQWNTTTVVIKGITGGSFAWGSQARGKTYDATARGYDWNVTIPKGLPGSVRTITPEDRIIGASINATHVQIWAINLNSSKCAIGTLLYNTAWKAPSAWAEGNQTISWRGASLIDNVGVIESKEGLCYYAFDLNNGKFLWGPSEPDNYLNMFDRITTINYGKMITSGTGGEIRCYNARTGERLWTYIAEDPYSEFTIGNHWWMQQKIIADGKLYLGQTEHSGDQPLPRNAPFICIDIETGKEVWKMDGGYRQSCWGGWPVMGDSILAFQDTYEQRIYAVGKGPSETDVTASPKVSVHGSSVLIEGTVMDISPGTDEYTISARFPKGVPAVSDDNMSDWMKYVYMQFERPMDIKGVDVMLYTIDPNNNYVIIGNTTSDINGEFSFQWTPEIPGKYTVYAQFTGSKSYWPSHDSTAIAVDSSTDTTPEPTMLPPSTVEQYFWVAVVAIIAVIVVCFIITILLLKKKQ